MTDWTKRIGFADHSGVVAEVEFIDAGHNNTGDQWDADVAVSVGIAGCQARGYPTKEACRQLAAALLDAADAMDRAEQETQA